MHGCLILCSLTQALLPHLELWQGWSYLLPLLRLLPLTRVDDLIVHEVHQLAQHRRGEGHLLAVHLDRLPVAAEELEVGSDREGVAKAGAPIWWIGHCGYVDPRRAEVGGGTQLRWGEVRS